MNIDIRNIERLQSSLGYLFLLEIKLKGNIKKVAYKIGTYLEGSSIITDVSSPQGR